MKHLSRFANGGLVVFPIILFFILLSWITIQTFLIIIATMVFSYVVGYLKEISNPKDNDN